MYDPGRSKSKKSGDGMNNLAENNVVRFISVVKKKTGLFVNFRVKGIKGGATISSSISVDASQADVDWTDPLEKIIESCAKIALRMFEARFQFEGMAQV